MNIAILGAGGIANTLADTMNKMPEVNLYAVAARDLDRAKAFACKNGVEKAYGSYEEMLSDDGVELLYIATPHSHHYEHMKMCIEHGKNVLCEKAFTINATQAREIKELANAKHVYVAEAIWTRYMPSRSLINEVIKSGIIGEPKMLTANLHYVISHVERLVDPNLAGGALLDVGIYCLNFALMHFGTGIEKIESSVQMTDTGVDGMESLTIFYKDGKMAVLNAGMYSRSDRKGIIYGDKGYMVVENINNPQNISVYNVCDELIKHIDVPSQISGYEYEIIEAINSIKDGKVESESMPLSDTIHVMEIMDNIRKDWGFIYPMEK